MSDMSALCSPEFNEETRRMMRQREDLSRVAEGAKTGDFGKAMRAKAKELVEAGESDPNLVRDKVHEFINQWVPHSYRDVADAISGYGKVRSETKNDLQARLNLIKSELRKSSRAEDISSGKYDPNAPKDRSRQTSLNREKAVLERRLMTGDYEKPVKIPPQYSAETQRLQGERDLLKRRVDAEIQKLKFANRSKVEKGADFLISLRRAVILSSVKTLWKLSAAAATRNVFTPIEEVAGAGLRHLPIVGRTIKKIGEMAPREGGGLQLGAEKAALKATFSKEMLRQAKDTALTGYNTVSARFSDHNEFYRVGDVGKLGKMHDAMELIGRIHGALKTPAKINEFTRSLARRSESEARQLRASGMSDEEIMDHMGNPATQAALGAAAYVDSNRAILMTNNLAVTLVHDAKRMLQRAGAPGSSTKAFGTAASKVIDWAIPIVKIPTNLAAEAGSYSLGIVKAIGQIIFAKGIKNLTPDQADYVLRNLKKQAVGAALIAIGYYNADQIGGYYQPGDSKDKNKPKAGTVRLWGHEVPTWLLHNPALEMLQVGATLRRVMNKQKSGSSLAKFGEGSKAAAKGILNEIPMIREPYEFAKGLDSPAKFAGEQVAQFIPPDVGNIARYMDNDRVRKPKTFTQAIENKIPGLRENVPSK